MSSSVWRFLRGAKVILSLLRSILTKIRSWDLIKRFCILVQALYGIITCWCMWLYIFWATSLIKLPVTNFRIWDVLDKHWIIISVGVVLQGKKFLALWWKYLLADVHIKLITASVFNYLLHFTIKDCKEDIHPAELRELDDLLERTSLSLAVDHTTSAIVLDELIIWYFCFNHS